MEHFVKQFISERDLFARHLGIELLKVGPGTARAVMPVDERHRNGLGLVHGGAIFGLADLAFAAASNSHGTAAVAINVSISYMNAARTGPLAAEAREVEKNPKLGTYEVRVTGPDDTLVAVFQGMVYRKKQALKDLV
jgi:acyl-CoA thioesterase